MRRSARDDLPERSVPPPSESESESESEPESESESESELDAIIGTFVRIQHPR